ncbi:hypothetical protein COZ63_00410, partial [Candidatus Berkelbacteria bacterium CG_4_8_14_3_um_filter_42_13]
IKTKIIQVLLITLFLELRNYFTRSYKISRRFLSRYSSGQALATVEILKSSQLRNSKFLS